MWWTKKEDGFRGWLVVQSRTGALVTGLDAGDFTVTIRDPSDAAQSVLTVVESGKAGLYYFDVASAFLIANGVGDYGISIEVSTPLVKAVSSKVLKVHDNIFDDLKADLDVIIQTTGDNQALILAT